MNATATRSDVFTLGPVIWQPDAPEIVLHYHCDRYGAFAETLSMPALVGTTLPAEMINELLSLLQIAAGVSYYKAAASKRMRIGQPISPAARKMASALYNDGLAEFFVRAGLDWPSDVDIEATETPGHAATTPPDGRAIVAFGGGKDSYVADHLVASAGMERERCSVVMSDKVAAAIQRCSDTPVTFLSRRLDPKLRHVTESGAYNGHVPITAINSLMLLFYGALTGAGSVVFANERSADEPTMQTETGSANHQFSKSGAFEKVLRDALSDIPGPVPIYYSALRPMSEILIARLFSDLKTPFERFTSCNRNFTIAGDQSDRWCGACAKCAFTSLLLAPHLSVEEFDQIFPARFLDADALQAHYAALCGLTEPKPWDCVGTLDECRATMAQLGHHPLWRESRAVRSLLPQIRGQLSDQSLSKAWRDGLALSSDHFLPDNIAATLLKVAGG